MSQDAVVERDLLFPTRIGTPMSGDDLLKRSLRSLLAKAGLPPVTFHELRHTFATFHLASAEKPEVIRRFSALLDKDPNGHLQPREPGMQQDAARRLSNLLFGSEPVTFPSKGGNVEKNDGERRTGTLPGPDQKMSQKEATNHISEGRSGGRGAYGRATQFLR